MKAMNPTTGELLGEYEEFTQGQLEEALSRAHSAQKEWKQVSFADRADLLRAAAAELRRGIATHAELMVLEMGKPVREARSEVEKCAWVCEYYAEKAEEFLSIQRIDTDASRSYVCFEPLGVVLAVMPWNFPFWQVFRFAAPGLMAGNGGLLKHASNVPGCALAIERIFQKAGFPSGVFQTLLVGSNRVDAIIEDRRVAAVTLTGSVPAGRAVAAKAGRMLKKTVLELGGSDPYVILEDANLEAAVAACVASRLINSGQSCIAAKRFVVVEAVRQAFEMLFVQRMAAIKMGDPLEEETQVGPQARHELRDELHEQVLRSIEKGARCLLGGTVPEGPGAFYPPTVLTDVRAGMPAYEEELFGPVAAIIAARDEPEAVQFANDSAFGLGAAVFTSDLSRGDRIAAKALEAGSCFVNTFVRSDPRLPFGGIKDSGYGRELSSFGIHEFVNTKTVYIA